MNTLLIVPDDDSLLAPEPGDARPPTMRSSRSCAYDKHRRWRPPGEHPNPSCYMCQHLDEALLLVHEGKPVPLGIFRLWHMAENSPIADLQRALTGGIDLAQWAASLRRNGRPLGTLRNADGQLVQPPQPTPSHVSKEEMLYEFILSAFSKEELSRILRWNYPALHRQFPDRESVAGVAEWVVSVMDASNIHGFLDVLYKERPRRKTDIDALRNAF